MGTEVLRPQDCLIDRNCVFPAAINHRRKNLVGNGKPNPKAPAGRKNRRRSASLDDLRKTPTAGKTPDAGPVVILRRGQSLGEISPSRADTYAGSAVVVSPSPSDLPLPSFFSKKAASGVSDDDSATRDLRRLLRLD